jgi:hypothetical protein
MIFSRWLLIFLLVVLGSVIMYLAGFIERINAADVTKVSFVILVPVLLWNGFGPRSCRVSLVMVPLVIWYSMALFYVPSHLLGWPSNDKIPEKFPVISFWVHEPLKDQKGGIYFWRREWDGKKPDRNLKSLEQACGYIPELMTPRAFRIDYSRALHKKLMKQREEVEQVAAGS